MNLRMMSFNIRTQTEYDKEQQFIYRVDFLCRKIHEVSPDVIGFQEVTPLMRGMLIDRLPEYAFLGGGREADRLGEAAIIGVLQKKFMIERVASEILSPEPHIPGTRYEPDQSSCPRVFTSCDLMPVEGGRPFRVMNIHTDHIGAIARKLEVQQLLTYYHEANALRPMPTLITGDFNALPDAEEMLLMTVDTGLADITAKLPGTFHNYDRLDETEKIDYIFASDGISVQNICSIHEKEGYLFLSDHDPIVADVIL